MAGKVTENHNGRFVFQRHTESQGFVCDRCLEPKVAKIVVEWSKESVTAVKKICNGCFGKLSGDNA